MVKRRLHIKVTDATYDTELDADIAQADAIIDNVLKNHVSVPLASPPQIIKEISADLAAGLYTRDTGPSNENKRFFEDGMSALETYIKETYLRPGVMVKATEYGYIEED